MLCSEVDLYNDYLCGNVYGFTLTDKKNAEDRKVPLRPEFFNFVKDRLIKLKKSDQKLVLHDWGEPIDAIGVRQHTLRLLQLEQPRQELLFGYAFIPRHW